MSDEKKNEVTGMHTYVPVSLLRDIKLAAALRQETMSCLIQRALIREIKQSLIETAGTKEREDA